MINMHMLTVWHARSPLCEGRKGGSGMRKGQVGVQCHVRVSALAAGFALISR